jgi:tetratricopeptide (TPR) repeat protein
MESTGAETSGQEPKNAQDFVTRALERQEAGDYAGAIADCNEALKLEPQSVQAYAARGIVRHGQGYLDRAVADYDRALSINPQEGRVYTLRGTVHLAQGKLDLARLDFDKAVEFDPANGVAFSYRAQIRMAQGDPAGAVADAGRALEIDPSNADAYLTRSASRWEEGDADGGLADCNEAIRLEPDEAKPYVLRANIHRTRGDMAAAQGDVRHALQLDPSLARPLRDQGFDPDAQGGGELARTAGPDKDEGPEDEDEGPLETFERRAPTVKAGPRPWVVAGAVQGALLGLLYGIMRETFTAILALLVFAPLFMALFFGRTLGPKQALLGGVALALAIIFLFLVFKPEVSWPLLQITTPHLVNDLCWVLGWAVMGTFLVLVSGMAHLGPMVLAARGGIGRALVWARGGPMIGILLGIGLGALQFLPGDVAGGMAGGVVGLILGRTAGHSLWSAILGMVGAGLGLAVGSADPEGVFRVIGAGLGGGLYWTVAGGLAGLFAGGSVGARAAVRITDGPLYTQLLGHIPLPKGQGLSLAAGLLMGLGGLFTGANIGLVGGSIFGGLAQAAQVGVDLPVLTEEGILPWVIGGGLAGLVLAAVFGSRVRPSGEAKKGLPLGRVFPLRGVPLALAGLIGLVAGAVLAALVNWFKADLGSVPYWVLAGAGMGTLLGAKLWSVAEK